MRKERKSKRKTYPLNNIKIREKLFLTYFICVLIPMIVTNCVMITTVKHNIRKEKITQMQGVCDRVAATLNGTMDNVKMIADYMEGDEKLNHFLQKKYISEENYYDCFNRFMTDNNIKFYYTAQSIYGCLIATDNDTITNGNYFVKMSDVEDSEWLKAWRENGEKMLLYPYYEEESAYAKYIDRPRYLSMIRGMNNYGGNNVLKIDVDYVELMDLIDKEAVDMDIYICDEEHILFSSKEKRGEVHPYSDISEYHPLELEECSTVYVPGAEWKIYVTAEDDTLKDGYDSKNGGQFFVGMILFNLILPTIMILLINKSFCERIFLINSHIRMAEKEEFQQIECDEGTDEIGELIHRYNLMAARIKELIEVVYKQEKQQKEIQLSAKQAELNALQSQINRHFMFNVIESIRMHSILKGEKETANILGEFALLMRRAIQWNEDCVTLKEECEYVKTYLDIQKFRFGERLRYSFYIQEECHQFEIPKFSILTLVENACIHGIEPSLQGGTITVTASLDENNIYVAIMDSGVGMDEEEVDKMREKMMNASIKDVEESKRIGLLNTMVRLKMYYEGQVQVEISSTPGEGTEIGIILPIPKEDKKDT